MSRLIGFLIFLILLPVAAIAALYIVAAIAMFFPHWAHGIASSVEGLLGIGAALVIMAVVQLIVGPFQRVPHTDA